MVDLKLRQKDDNATQRRKGRSCCGWFFSLATALVSLVVILVLAKAGAELYHVASLPHAFMYENKTLEEVQDLQTVVRPLVDEQQKFDIVATVWVPTSKTVRGRSLEEEDHIFSDVIFRGLTLQDKHVHAQVNLSIPLNIL